MVAEQELMTAATASKFYTFTVTGPFGAKRVPFLQSRMPSKRLTCVRVDLLAVTRIAMVMTTRRSFTAVHIHGICKATTPIHPVME